MTILFARPQAEEVLAHVRRCFPHIHATGIDFLSEGMDSWAFEVRGEGGGPYIIRIPKHGYTLRSQAIERKLMPVIAPLLPLPVPDMALGCDEGPNGHPFAGYQKIPGVPISELPGFQSAAIGAPLGRFLRALHSVPVPRPEALGLDSGEILEHGVERAWYHHLGELYEDVVRQVFPRLSCEARQMTAERFESFLHDSSNFDMGLVIIHADLDRDHVLVDPASGQITGVIDFGDVMLGDPAHDFASILEGGLGSVLGPEGIAAALDAYGPEARGPGFGERAAFYRSLVPYHEALGGLYWGDEDVLEEGLRQIAEFAKGRKPCP